jgi:hypothetical protein
VNAAGNRLNGMATMDATGSISSTHEFRFASGIRSRITHLFDAIKQPERWALLSSCDWYPDPSLYPSNHAALLMLDSTDQHPT